MFVKTLVIDGFKSYANRVEIDGFDPKFNAITGLNGTGKSNILDAICFVLGITNLSNMRVSNLQELIFKSGNAGINKCSVSITFDNRDKAQCPLGYEQYNEITVTRMILPGGRNKFFLNGVVVQNKKIADLFGSVQLNVNNPHFLIMQGRITKVLNMRPPEILSMVEEAAGTRMYESKKQAAQKTIEKKDAKLKELNDIIREDIAPKLQKLSDERAQYQEYQKVVRELESLQKLNIAWRYVKAEENMKISDEKISEMETDMQNKKDQIESNAKEVEELDKQIQEITKRLDEESGSVLKALEQELSEAERAAGGASSARAQAADALQHAERKLRLATNTHQDDLNVLALKNDNYQQAVSAFGELKAEAERAEAALVTAQSAAVSAGAGGGTGGTLQDQLMEAKKEASEASTRVSANGMELRHCEERARALQVELRDSAGTADRDADRDAAAIRDLQARARTLQAQLEGEGGEGGEAGDGGVSELECRVKSLSQAVRSLRDQIDSRAAVLQSCNFHYHDPEPNFNRERVLGPVCRLLSVSDPTYCAALEAVAGGRLYNVVVDTDATSRLVLEKGQLRSRTTLIPLNKIQPHTMERSRVRRAQDIGGGPDNVELAINLISFPERVRPAMEWVFGQTLVCRDLNTAKTVTYHPDVRRRCVTLEGDVFDPSGTISGGAKVEGRAVLERVAELRRLESSLEEDEGRLQDARHALIQAQRQSDTRRRYSQVCHELEVVRARTATTWQAALGPELAALHARVAQLKQLIADDEEVARAAGARALLLHHQLDDLHGHREREFKKAQDALAKAKVEAEKKSALWMSKQQEYETLRLEVADLETATAASARQLDELRRELEHANERLEQAHLTLQEKEAVSAAVRERMSEQRAAMSARDSEAGALHRRQATLRQHSDRLGLQLQEDGHTLDNLRADRQALAGQTEALARDNPWLDAERQHFGLAGGLYDFRQRGAAASGQRLQQLRERKDRLARGLNTKAHTLLGREEEQYQDVMNKKKIVEADRAKLVHVIAQLDENKRNKLVTACQQVNKDFGSIFSILLPGSQAEMVPPAGKSVLDGLEIRVGFSGVWKSLHELSGGQRSLVALSLVLAMLLFRPAPLYILDEIDSALDLSHTQNIGAMLHKHFQHSQFIIVSLKDGMFNNANVLYRTQFVDGMSSVTRTRNERNDR